MHASSNDADADTYCVKKRLKWFFFLLFTDLSASCQLWHPVSLQKKKQIYLFLYLFFFSSVFDYVLAKYIFYRTPK